jgi:predicted outer membrane protein
MVHRDFFKVMLVAIIAFTLVMPLHGQTNAQRGEGDRRSQTTDRPQSDDRTGTQSGPLEQAIELNVAEIEVGKLASSKAQNARVKDFAETMVKDHTQGLDKLRAIPGAPSDAKPNSKHQQTAERLSKLSGADFDREYMKRMVSGHQQAVRFLEKEAAKGKSETRTSGTTVKPGAPPDTQRKTNPTDRDVTSGRTAGSSADRGGSELSKVAQELLPTVRQHLRMAQDIQKELAASSTRTPNSTTEPKTGDSVPNRSTTPDRGTTPDRNTSPDPGRNPPPPRP